MSTELQKFAAESVTIKEEDIKRIEAFNARLNTNPPDAEIKINEMANNSKYLPISFVQVKLDEIFLGMWSFKMEHYEVVVNEIVGHGTLTVINPVTGQKIERSGSAAVVIQQHKDSSISDVSKKIKNTLVKDFPHLQAECLKSAAKTLGKIFGRDLNRKFQDSYNPEYSPEIDRSKINPDIKEELKKATSLDALRILWDSISTEEQLNPELKKIFASKKAELKLAKS
jgi:hypothetical protein